MSAPASASLSSWGCIAPDPWRTPCCLRHRLRKDPLETIDSGDRLVKVFCKMFERGEPSDRRALQLALAA